MGREGGRGRTKKRRRRRRKEMRESDDEVCVFFFKRQKFSEFKEIVKVGKKISARVEHICKTPPGWNKETVWEAESQNCYT